jgi:hypothetical protein
MRVLLMRMIVIVSIILHKRIDGGCTHDGTVQHAGRWVAGSVLFWTV